MTVIPTYSHLELYALRERVSSRLREFGIRAHLPKLELPKLAALAELIEASLQQSNSLRQRFLKNLLLGLMLLLESYFAEPEPEKQPDFINAQGKRQHNCPNRLEQVKDIFVGHPVRVLWCCFRN